MKPTEDPDLARGFYIGVEMNEVVLDPSVSVDDWITRTKIERFDSATGKESWFYFFNPSHMKGFIAHASSVRQGRWRGPGWYHTSLRRVNGQRWLTLAKGDIFDAFARRFAMSDDDKVRFDAFVARLKER